MDLDSVEAEGKSDNKELIVISTPEMVDGGTRGENETCVC